MALESGLYLYGLENGSLTVLASPEPEAGTRFNDGKCDRMGRFWAGTMDLDCRASIGSLYCLDGNLTCPPWMRRVPLECSVQWLAAGSLFARWKSRPDGRIACPVSDQLHVRRSRGKDAICDVSRLGLERRAAMRAALRGRGTGVGAGSGRTMRILFFGLAGDSTLVRP